MSMTPEKQPATALEQDTSRTVSPPLYSYTFFAKEATFARKSLVPGLLLPVIYNAVLLWTCLALFLGSLIRSNDISRISITAVNLDDGSFGSQIIGGISTSLQAPGPHFQWHFATSSASVNDAWSRHQVLDEKTWAVLQVSANASDNLRNALSNGEASYDPTSAVTLYFASARNQVTTLAITIPPLMALLNSIISNIAINTTSTYMQSSNGTLPLSALQCPQCLVSPFAIKQTDLIPFSSTIATGMLSTGLIFLLTFTFNIFTVLRAGAERHGHIFTLPTTLKLRTICSLAAYLFLSLMYTLAIRAFSVSLNGHFSRPGAGFMILWLLHFFTMGACGLVMESICTVIGMEWGPYLLNIWLILNASGAFASFEIMPSFYKYGYAMPFYHCAQGVRTIVFGTKNRLGLNFGVLGAWMLVGWGGVVIFTTWRVRTGKRTGVHRVP
ncbi:hypothetical protein BKA63DRAFT_608550 [Paraphoma chrysanthemicola]|nr:hypothetical protein BKA63DRAFT_608550 [Paraphoma chrysanthemicola]